jgi:hypothetical protein
LGESAILWRRSRPSRGRPPPLGQSMSVSRSLLARPAICPCDEHVHLACRVKCVRYPILPDARSLRVFHCADVHLHIDRASLGHPPPRPLPAASTVQRTPAFGGDSVSRSLNPSIKRRPVFARVGPARRSFVATIIATDTRGPPARSRSLAANSTAVVPAPDWIPTESGFDAEKPARRHRDWDRMTGSALQRFSEVQDQRWAQSPEETAEAGGREDTKK